MLRRKSSQKDLISNKVILEGIDYKIQDCGYETPCWVWLRKLSADGYGTLRIWYKTYWSTITAHKFIHCQKFNLDPFTTKHAHHKCVNRCCVNPEHIELITLGENVLCGNGISANNARLEICRRCNGELKLRKRRNRKDSRYCPVCQYNDRKKVLNIT